MGKVLQDDLIQLFNCMNPAAQAGQLGTKLDDALAGMMTNNNININVSSTSEEKSKEESKSSKATKII